MRVSFKDLRQRDGLTTSIDDDIADGAQQARHSLCRIVVLGVRPDDSNDHQQFGEDGGQLIHIDHGEISAWLCQQG